jgi:hypothetical protein
MLEKEANRKNRKLIFLKDIDSYLKKMITNKVNWAAHP